MSIYELEPLKLRKCRITIKKRHKFQLNPEIYNKNCNSPLTNSSTID